MSPRRGVLLPCLLLLYLPLVVLAGLPPVTRPPIYRALSQVVCTSPVPVGARPTTTASVLRSEALGDGSNLRITTVLVFFPPHAFTPRHVHGGALTAYVVSGRVKSQLNDGPVAELQRGDTFHEAIGTTHSFIENPDDEPASVLATIVHPPGAILTTLVPD